MFLSILFFYELSQLWGGATSISDGIFFVYEVSLLLCPLPPPSKRPALYVCITSVPVLEKFTMRTPHSIFTSVSEIFDKTSQELGNCPMGQSEALLKERLY